MRYRNGVGEVFNDVTWTADEKTMFYRLMHEYQKVNSWEEFQKRTAQPVVKMAKKKSQRGDGTYHFQWEKYFLYRIRFDLLRNVGIRTGELPGELSDMVIG